MQEISFDGLGLPVRDDIRASERRAWRRLAAPGTWWNGAERLAIAAEARHAAGCPLCRTRKAALSPRQPAGEHASLGALPAAAVEAIHAIRTDPGRLTRDWFEGVLAAGLTEERYVELVGVVVTTVVVDTFHRGLGLPVPALPEVATTGAPRCHRPAGARHQHHWVSTLSPGDARPEDPNPYEGNRAANIHRALSLVPEEVIGFFDLVGAHYLSGQQMMDLGNEPRAIDRAQIELLAARVSALNQCVY
jgi:hypothetical protein